MVFEYFLVCVVVVLAACPCEGKNVGNVKWNSSLLNEGRWYFYVDKSTGRMVSAVADQSGQFQDCYVSGDSSVIRLIVQSVPQSNVTEVDKGTMDQIADDCIFAKNNGLFTGMNGENVWQRFGIFSGLFIYPGTKWCGAGNVSSDYDDLGPEHEADSCCREHDHCEENIEAYESKYGLDNSSPYTKSHCDCDLAFHQCLELGDTRTSHRVGRMYFNLLQIECFRQDHPVSGCKKYKGWFRRRCMEYEFDFEREMEWQFFDARHYEGPPEDDDEDNEIEDEVRGDLFDYMQRLANEDENMLHHVVLKKIS